MKEEHVELVAFLEAAKQATVELRALEEQAGASEIEGKKCEKALSAERKAVADQVSAVIRQRREEIAATYDRELRNDQEKLKKVKAKREKAKNKGIKARIEEETADLSAENRQLDAKVSTLFRQNHLPWFCNTHLYYALFFTRSPGDFLTLALTVLICFLLVPCGIFFAVPDAKWWYLIVIYLLTIVVFMGLYIVTADKTKVDNMEILRQGRKIRLQIKANKRQIKAIRRSIERDKDEDLYNLEKYDKEIREIEKEIREISARKEDALYVFENNTALVLTKEIKQNSQERLNQLSSRKEECEGLYKTLSAQLKTMTINVADQYESRIGREFMSPEKLDALIKIFQEGKANSLSEAQELYRNRLN